MIAKKKLRFRGYEIIQEMKRYYTVRQMAYMLDMNETTLYKLKNNRDVNTSTVEKFMNAFNLPLEELFEVVEEENN
ncbi:helix-turn-helix domain-containing protein [Bacillus licheniformis]|uniref:helix-turn-helix domain-containing protein n=1 Tax=Bacillus licheniformis TaxID=1402 RepID=UPI002E1A30F0|nr:helix-turn-helix domain-containing protein [Bacillus licheniformis]